MIKVATVFSGIGAFEFALKDLHIPHEIVFACDNGERHIKLAEDRFRSLMLSVPPEKLNEEIEASYLEKGGENLVEKSYKANYPIENNRFFQDIRFLNGKQFCGQIDVFVGGSPCQSFSVMGKRGGLEETRGTLFYEYARLISEIKPKIFLFENVPGMLNHDNGKTWEIIKRVFGELDYELKYMLLNAKDFGLPQNRRRLFVVGFRKSLRTFFEKMAEPKQEPLLSRTEDFLDKKVDLKYYLPEKGFYRVTDAKNRKYVVVNSLISRCQVACQQYNWFGDMRFESNFSTEIENDTRIFKGEYKGIRGVTRCLTPRECLRLMGFSDKFKIVVNDAQMYRQSGNSIAVNVLKAIIRSIVKTGVFNE